MTKKYEFVPDDEIVIEPGSTVKRIRALVAITARGVLPGNLGGYIESDGNLTQVSGDAWVYGDAQVSGRGLIFWASIIGTEYGILTVYNAKDNTLEVTRGCFHGTVDKFLAAYASKHDEITQHEYKLLIEVATSRITRALADVK